MTMSTDEGGGTGGGTGGGSCFADWECDDWDDCTDDYCDMGMMQCAYVDSGSCGSGGGQPMPGGQPLTP